MDRYFKLRQMFCDFLDNASGESTKTPPTPIAYPQISTMNEEIKKQWAIKKITEEEGEKSFDSPQEHFRPVLCQEPAADLRWFNKNDGGRCQMDSEGEAASRMAQKLLTLFLKTEMLESVTFKYNDIRAIRVYFMCDREVPDDRLLAIFDNILGVSMNKLGQFSDKISVAVDYEMRAFMHDQKKAKRLVLETMLKYPEFIPDSWGGESAILKWKEMKEADVRRRETDAKDILESEKKEREEKCKKEEEKAKNEEEKAKKEKERVEKEEKIKKEVEEAEKKKKEEKENRRREIKKNREVDRTRKDNNNKKEVEEKTAFEKNHKEVVSPAPKNKKDTNEKKKKKKKKTVETTKTKDLSQEEQPLHHSSPKTPPVVGGSLPSTPPILQSPASPQPHRTPPHPHQTPPRKPFSVASVGMFLSGRKRRDNNESKSKESKEKLGEMKSTDKKRNILPHKK